MLTPNEAYQYDGTFRRVEDLMVAYLREFQITPAELRQAAMLASSMHEARRIRPLLISKSSRACTAVWTTQFYTWMKQRIFPRLCSEEFVLQIAQLVELLLGAYLVTVQLLLSLTNTNASVIHWHSYGSTQPDMQGLQLEHHTPFTAHRARIRRVAQG